MKEFKSLGVIANQSINTPAAQQGTLADQQVSKLLCSSSSLLTSNDTPAEEKLLTSN